jgi:predicted transposase/invertase (TIGR01784 family)
MQAKYINPFTDFGFKKLFGEEVNKDLLKDFLNQLLPPQHIIHDLTFKPTENLGATAIDRKAIFDIYCESTSGDKFIVELQKAKQNFFKDRSVFYSTFPIREQAEQGDWNYKLKAVYCVGILDFVFEETRQSSEYLHRVQLKDDKCAVFYDKLTFVFVEMPKFTKQENELESRFDKWLYFIKYLERFEQIPSPLREQIFEKAFQSAEIAKFDRTQLDQYEYSLKTYRDWKGVTDTAFFDGEIKGREEGKLEGKLEERREIAGKLRQMGMAAEAIAQITGLSEREY